MVTIYFINSWFFIYLCRHDGKPEDVLNPKKKQFEKIAVVRNLEFYEYLNLVYVQWWVNLPYSKLYTYLIS